MNSSKGKSDNDAYNKLEELMRIHGNMVLRTAYMYVKNKETAEDIFQEVFLSAYNAFEDFRNEASYSTWLYRITVNKCKDYLKSAYNRNVVLADEDNDFDDNDGAVFGREKSAEDIFMETANAGSVREAVMALPAKYKDVVMAVYFKELDMSETAKILNIPEGTVKSRLYRAKEALKELLRNEFLILLFVAYRVFLA